MITIVSAMIVYSLDEVGLPLFCVRFLPMRRQRAEVIIDNSCSFTVLTTAASAPFAESLTNVHHVIAASCIVVALTMKTAGFSGVTIITAAIYEISVTVVTAGVAVI